MARRRKPLADRAYESLESLGKFMRSLDDPFLRRYRKRRK
jgi:hypothetical protein